MAMRILTATSALTESKEREIERAAEECAART